jgi:aspartate aminotransferase-like enzyme
VHAADVVPRMHALLTSRYLLNTYNLEIGGGLGELAGKVWRIGLMGFNSRPEVVIQILAGLREGLAQQVRKVASHWQGSHICAVDSLTK